MRYVLAYPGRRGPTLLHDGATGESVSAECRSAAVEFMTGVATGWTKRDLARWLTGPYARVTRHVAHGERTRVSGEVIARVERVQELLTNTRRHLLLALKTAELLEGALDFAGDAVDRGFVRRALDEGGREVWVPVDAARMRLRDRLGALFVADYLNSPDAYATLYVCPRCESVVFDANARRLGTCSTHRRVSGVVAKHDADADARDADAAGRAGDAR